MPLFSVATARGKEAPALHYLAALLSGLATFQELSEQTSEADALALIAIGSDADPIDGEQFTIEELENKHFFCSVFPSDEEAHVTQRGPSLTECPLEGGQISIYLRRAARAAELAADNGRNDVYLFFLDCISALEHELQEASVAATTTTINITGTRRLQGPFYANLAEVAGQGEYLWALLEIDWGDLDGGGGD